MFATFNRFEIQLTKKQAEQGSHQGDCEADCRELLKNPKIRKQLEKIGIDKIRLELDEYGAWNDEELQDEEMCFVRIIWIACGNIVEGNI
jgi:hypothetical protein